MEITVQAAERAGAPASRLYSLRGLMNTLAGRGAVAVQQLEQIAQEERSPSDWETLTRAAMQSGDSRLARRAAAQCATSFEARIALAELDINDGRIGTGIAAARTLSEDLSLSAKQRARAFAMLALGHSQNGGTTAANAALGEAESLDAACSSLHLVKAELAEQGGRDVAPHLRMAVQAPTPIPDAVGWLALELRSGSEACRLAQQYLEAAPRGYDNREIRGIRCP